MEEPITKPATPANIAKLLGLFLAAGLAGVFLIGIALYCGYSSWIALFGILDGRIPSNTGTLAWLTFTGLTALSIGVAVIAGVLSVL